MKSYASVNQAMEPIDTLRISDRDWMALVTAIEAQSASARPSEKRSSRSPRYRSLNSVVIRLQHPGGTQGAYKVRSRNLSPEGMAFIHGSFIYPKSPVTAILSNKEGQLVSVGGKIARCAHVTGKFHEIGVRFDSPIFIEEFVKDLVRAKRS